MSAPHQDRESSKPDRIVVADASRGGLDTGTAGAVARFAVVGARDESDDTAKIREEDEFLLDPAQIRLHDLQRDAAPGVPDRRLSLHVVNDFDAEYTPDLKGMSPYAQAEEFTALNRSTREADTQGRVALPASQRRIVDSEDGLFALAHTLNELPFASPSEAGALIEEQVPIVAGVDFREAGTESGTGGSVVRREPSVSINGLTIKGEAAVEAAKDALRRGGTAQDARDAALAADKGQAPPPLRTEEREAPSEPPPAAAIPSFKKPGGYVVSQNRRVGVLGSFFTPDSGEPFTQGREGTPIGTLPMRHDAQVALGEGKRGRFHIKRDDVASLPEARSGELVKGWLMPDSSVAGQDTELPGDTMQLRPVIRVTAKIPPSVQPPPPEPPPEDEPKEPEGSLDGGPGAAAGGRKPGPGGSSGENPPTGDPGPSPYRLRFPDFTGPILKGGGLSGAGGGPGPGPGPGPGGSGSGGPGPAGGSGSAGAGAPTGGGVGVVPGSGDGVRGGVSDPEAQGRDLSGHLYEPVPCPNATAGGTGVHRNPDDGSAGAPTAPEGLPGGVHRNPDGSAGAPTVTDGPLGPYTPYDGYVPGGQVTAGYPAVQRVGSQVWIGGRQPAPFGFVPLPGSNPVQVLSGVDRWGLPHLDARGLEIAPSSFDPVNDTRVPVAELDAEAPIHLLPKALQAKAKAERAARKQAEKEAKAAEKAAKKAEREAERAKGPLDKVGEGIDARAAKEAKKFEDEKTRLTKARDAERARNGGKPSRESQRLTDQLAKLERARVARKERNDKAKERNDKAKAARDAREKAREKARKDRKEKQAKRRAEAEARGAPPKPDKGKAYVVDVTDPENPIGYIPDPASAGLNPDQVGAGERTKQGDPGPDADAESTRARYGDFGGTPAEWGSHNVLTTPVPLLGQIGGPANVEGQLAWLSYAVEAQRRVIMGAFGGPSTLASNVAVIHRNTAGNPPAGSVIGSIWRGNVGQTTQINGTPFTALGSLHAPEGSRVVASGGGIASVVREHTGPGSVTDLRPALYVDNRTRGEIQSSADAFAVNDRRAAITGEGGLLGSSLVAHRVDGETTDPLEVATVPKGQVGRHPTQKDKLAWIPLSTQVLAASRGFMATKTYNDGQGGGLLVAPSDSTVVVDGIPLRTRGGSILITDDVDGTTVGGLTLTRRKAGSTDGTTVLSMTDSASGNTRSRIETDVLDPEAILFVPLAARPAEFVDIPDNKPGLWVDEADDDNRPVWWTGDCANGATDRPLAFQDELGASGLPKRYVEGLVIRYASSSTITVSAGKARDKADGADMTLSSEVTVSTASSGALGFETKTLTGTATVTNGSNSVTGSGTAFLTEFCPSNTRRSLTGTISSSGGTVTGTGTKFLSELSAGPSGSSGDLIGTTDAKGFWAVTAIASDTSLTISLAGGASDPGFATGDAGGAKVIECPQLGTAGGRRYQVERITSNTALRVGPVLPSVTETGVAITATAGVPNPAQTTQRWRSVWLVSGGSGTSVVLSTQRTTPLLVGPGTVSPSGYGTSYRRIGWVFLAGTTHNLYAQYGTDGGSRRWVNYESSFGDFQGAANASSTTTYQDVNLAIGAPPTCRRVQIMLLQLSPNTVDYVMVRGRGLGSTGGRTRSVLAPTTSTESRLVFDTPCDGAQVIQHRSNVSTTGDGTYIDLTAYEDTLE